MSMDKTKKMTPSYAHMQGFTIDNTCYPWIAYKGPRFRPDEIYPCYTDTEAALIAQLETLRWAAGDLARIIENIPKQDRVRLGVVTLQPVDRVREILKEGVPK